VEGGTAHPLKSRRRPGVTPGDCFPAALPVKMASSHRPPGDVMADSDNPHISQLQTRWTLLARAQPGEAHAREAAAELLPRYCAAIYTYVLGALGDETAADEECQDFALRFIRGDFRHARPERGRFRDYV